MAPEIRKTLVLSTAHVPAPDAHVGGSIWQEFGPSDVPGWTWFLWVPDDPQASSDTQEEETAHWALQVQLRARALGCDYVLFDVDGERDSALPTWGEW
jgi:hypothetical protein